MEWKRWEVRHVLMRSLRGREEKIWRSVSVGRDERTGIVKLVYRGGGGWWVLMLMLMMLLMMVCVGLCWFRSRRLRD